MERPEDTVEEIAKVIADNRHLLPQWYYGEDTVPIIELQDEVLARLVSSWGGTRVYIPHVRTVPGSKLAATVGEEAATALARRFAGSRLPVPSLARFRRNLPERWRRIETMSQEGHSVAAIARTLDVHERSVYRARAELGIRREVAGVDDPTPLPRTCSASNDRMSATAPLDAR